MLCLWPVNEIRSWENSNDLRGRRMRNRLIDGKLVVMRSNNTMTSDREFRQPPRELVYYADLHDGTMVVFDGTVYRKQDDGPNGPPLKSFDPERYREVNRLRRHSCNPGEYPWDQWHAWALEDGVPKDLAELGRSLIREADQHSWSAQLQDECGWNDSGAKMLRLAKEQPEAARKRWGHLMETDGERGNRPIT